MTIHHPGGGSDDYTDALMLACWPLRLREEDSEIILRIERTSWGIVHVRTDGRPVLVFTHSGRENMKEAYRFRVDAQHRAHSRP